MKVEAVASTTLQHVQYKGNLHSNGWTFSHLLHKSPKVPLHSIVLCNTSNKSVYASKFRVQTITKPVPSTHHPTKIKMKSQNSTHSIISRSLVFLYNIMITQQGHICIHTQKYVRTKSSMTCAYKQHKSYIPLIVITTQLHKIKKGCLHQYQPSYASLITQKCHNDNINQGKVLFEYMFSLCPCISLFSLNMER